MYLVVLSTWACNLRCTYCCVQKKNIFISEDKLKKAVDLLLTSKQKELKFEFFGGEPLLLPFSLIKKTVIYGEKKAIKQGKRIDFIITTNGISLDKEMVDFFKKHNILLIISLDGSRESQNINRPQVGKKDSFSLIVKNLPLMFDKKIDCYCYTVVTPETVDFLDENFLSLIKLGFKKIWVMVACCRQWKDKKISLLEKHLNRIKQAYPYLLARQGVVLLNLKNWKEPVPFNTELSVNMDGYIYSACLTYLIHDDDVRKKYIIGHIDDKNQNIDELDKKRLSNMEALKVIYEENGIKRLIPNTLRAGEVFTRFRDDLCKELKHYNLWELYRAKAGLF